MTIAETIKKEYFKETEESIKDVIKDTIINSMKYYNERVVSFVILQYNIAKPFIVARADAPFPQIIIDIYIPEGVDIRTINQWLREEGFEWDMLGGEYAWRLK